MNETRLEPGLISVFRLYIGLRAILMLLNVSDIAIDEDADWDVAFYLGVSVVEISLLSLYLFWPPMQRKLSMGHLPIALGISATLPIIAMSAFYYGRLNTEPDIAQHIIYAGGYELLVGLLFTLFLISWQYNFGAVVIFCVWTTILQIALVAWPLSQDWSNIESMFELLGIRVIIFLILGYLIVRLMNIQREQRRALREANNQLVAYAATMEQLAVSRERNRMARELHDTLAHTLSGLAVQLDSMTTLWDSMPPEANTMLTEALTTTRSGLDETRRALQDLRASPLEDLGLNLAIRTLAEDAAARGKLSLEIELTETINNLPPDVEHCFYRVAQESLENVLKHAQAQQVSIHLSQTNEMTTLTISDNGEGFVVDQSAQEYHFGIKGMYERAEMIGAQLDITSQSGQGTTVNLRWQGKE
jgi:signal transduction histidine kinase